MTISPFFTPARDGGVASIDWQKVALSLRDEQSDHSVADQYDRDQLGDDEMLEQNLAYFIEREFEANALFETYPELAIALTKWQLYWLWDAFCSDYYRAGWISVGRDSWFFDYLLGRALEPDARSHDSAQHTGEMARQALGISWQ